MKEISMLTSLVDKMNSFLQVQTPMQIEEAKMNTSLANSEDFSKSNSDETVDQ